MVVMGNIIDITYCWLRNIISRKAKAQTGRQATRCLVEACEDLLGRQGLEMHGVHLPLHVEEQLHHVVAWHLAEGSVVREVLRPGFSRLRRMTRTSRGVS